MTGIEILEGILFLCLFGLGILAFIGIATSKF